MKKRVLSAIFAMVMVCMMTACGSGASTSEASGEGTAEEAVNDGEEAEEAVATSETDTNDAEEETAEVEENATPEPAKQELEDGYMMIYYDSEGHEIKYEIFAADDTLKESTLMEYDSDGNKVKVTWLDGEGNITGHEDTEYSNGNRIRETYYNSDDEAEEINEWYGNGNKKHEELIRREDSGRVFAFIDDYDENGTLIREAYTYDDGVTLQQETLYDENGDKIKDVYYKSDGVTVASEELANP